MRLLLVFVMLASLLMAVAIPEGFGDHALLFAASYCALQLGRNAFVVAVTPPGEPGHFAERFQLCVIIVLGESIVLTGATASDVGLEASVVVALGFAFLSSVALWWLYFGQVATSAVRRIAADEVPGQVGRDAYTYLHLPIVAGVLLTAVGDELVVAHPSESLGTAGALVALGGPALYLLGVVAFGARIGRHEPWTRGRPPWSCWVRSLSRPRPMACWSRAC